MLRAILNKSWRQHPTRHQLYGHLPPITKTIQVRRARHAGHCWRSRDDLMSDVLLWTPTHGRAKAGRPARTYIQQLCEDTGCCPEDLPRAMNDREEWRERVRDIRATSAIWWWWLPLCRGAVSVFYSPSWQDKCIFECMGIYIWECICMCADKCIDRMCVCVRMYMCVCVYVWIRTSVRVSVCDCICEGIYVCLYVRVNVLVCKCLCICVCACVCSQNPYCHVSVAYITYTVTGRSTPGAIQMLNIRNCLRVHLRWRIFTYLKYHIWHLDYWLSACLCHALMNL